MLRQAGLGKTDVACRHPNGLQPRPSNSARQDSRRDARELSPPSTPRLQPLERRIRNRVTPSSLGSRSATLRAGRPRSAPWPRATGRGVSARATCRRDRREMPAGRIRRTPTLVPAAHCWPDRRAPGRRRSPGCAGNRGSVTKSWNCSDEASSGFVAVALTDSMQQIEGPDAAKRDAAN
jgi:hypothetical protein